MPVVTTKSGEEKHFPYTPKGIKGARALAKKMKKKYNYSGKTRMNKAIASVRKGLKK